MTFKLLWEHLINKVCFYPEMSILDAGCGSGNLTFLLAKKVPKGNVIGIDSSESMIQMARKTLIKQNVQNLEFHLCGINEIDYRNQFDLVFSNSVFHWVIDIEDGLRRLFRALKRNGMIEVQFPMLNVDYPLVRYARRAISELGLMKYYENWSFPWYVPESRESFIEKLKEVGFINAEASLVKNDFYFPSANAVYQHFNSVGLELYTSPLNEKEKKEFSNCIVHDLVEDFPNEASLQYERIYAGAQKLGNM